MDKFRDDFKEDSKHLDWMKYHPQHERKEVVAEDGNDPTVIDIGDEDLSEWARKHNLHNVDEWLEMIKKL